MEHLKKEITFIATDNVEKSCFESIAEEAIKRGYKVLFSNDKFRKCEIGFYISHLNFPKNSKFSAIMIHDLGQQHTHWPVMWQNEFWNHFDIGFLPSIEWVNMWHNASCYDFARPRNGCYFSGWTKADKILSKDFSDECERIISEYKIDSSKKNILYAPSWEWDGRQLEMVEIAQNLDINLLIKQFPWISEDFPDQCKTISEMNEKARGKKNVYILDSNINIFNAINMCDLLVSEESSTLFEAMLMGKPVVAVTDWLIPDSEPPRMPDFPYDFAVKVNKSELKDAIKNILSDSSYLEKIRKYKDENFPRIGDGAKIVMDVVDHFVCGGNLKEEKIEELPLVKTHKEYRKSVKTRKTVMKKYFIKEKLVKHSKTLTALYEFYRKMKWQNQSR